jgi:hypothetical protein
MGLETDKKQSQYRMEREPFVYGAKDCHGPSGLAMTAVSLLLCASVPFRLRSELALSLSNGACFVAKSQFEKTKPIYGELNGCKYLYERGL